MVEVTGTYEGNLRVRSVHGPSGTELVTDAPVDNQGKGESFSPTDLVATALGSCVLTILALLAERRGIDFTGASFHVKKEMVADPDRRIGRIGLSIRLPESIPPAERPAFEAAAHACPVHRSVSDRTERPIEFVYGPPAG